MTNQEIYNAYYTEGQTFEQLQEATGLPSYALATILKDHSMYRG